MPDHSAFDKGYLAKSEKLFERLYKVPERKEQAGEILNISENEKSSFRWLNEIRNDFTHFKQQSYLICIEDFLIEFKNIISIIDKIAADPYPFRHLDLAYEMHPQMPKLEELLQKLREHESLKPVARSP